MEAVKFILRMHAYFQNLSASIADKIPKIIEIFFVQALETGLFSEVHKKIQRHEELSQLNFENEETT